MTLPGGGTWHYEYTLRPVGYDPSKYGPVLTNLTDDQGRIVEYQTDLQGGMDKVRYNEVYDGNGALVSYCQANYGYDMYTNGPNGGNSKLELKTLSSTFTWPNQYGYPQTRIINQNDYTTDNAGNRLSNTISIQNLNPDGTPQFDSNNNPVFTSRTETYGYDELNRLTSVNYGDGGTQSYSFDNTGNRLQKVDSSTGTENYSYNAANMLLTRGSNGYTNDADANTLAGGGRTNVWDSQNRLVSCSFNGNTSSYIYGADGLRHQSTVNGVTTDFALDGDSVVREGQTTGSVFTPSVTYLTGAMGPIYRRDDTAGGVRWYVFDGLGSVVDEVDPSGNLTDTRGFDVYGAVRSNSGTATSRHGFSGSLGHTGENETGLIYMRARYMDPVVGRFVSEDPERSGKNWFEYASSNPVTSVDRSGKWPWLIQMILTLDSQIPQPLKAEIGSWAGYWFLDPLKARVMASLSQATLKALTANMQTAIDAVKDAELDGPDAADDEISAELSLQEGANVVEIEQSGEVGTGTTVAGDTAEAETTAASATLL